VQRAGEEQREVQQVEVARNTAGDEGRDGQKSCVECIERDGEPLAELLLRQHQDGGRGRYQHGDGQVERY
jgi:hypothetical protein